MKKQFTCLPYTGAGGYAYFGCAVGDEPVAAQVAELLIARGFRLSCNACGSKLAQTPASAAQSIANCLAAVVFLSEKSTESLAFRNEINYLLSLRKPLVCVKVGAFSLSYGLDMQLANIEMLSYTTPAETAEALIAQGLLTQELMGEGMERRTFNRKRLTIMAAMAAAALLIFGLGVNAVIQKRTSAAFVLQDVDGSEYVNIAGYGDAGLAAMAGKTVGELDLSGGDFTSLNAIGDVSAATVNVSDISADIPLWPLGQVEGIQAVIISQDQVLYARDLCQAGITVVVTH